MPEPKLLLPKFLTEEIVKSAAYTAIKSVKELLFTQVATKIKIETCCIVVLVPAMKDDRATEYADWPDYPIRPHPIEYCYHKDVGVKPPWLERFRSIAQCEALQLWHGRNDGGTDIMPHLLFPGDTPFWGGVRSSGIVVACFGGLRPHFHRMIAGMTAELCIALAYDAWENSFDKTDGELCFLT